MNCFKIFVSIWTFQNYFSSSFKSKNVLMRKWVPKRKGWWKFRILIIEKEDKLFLTYSKFFISLELHNSMGVLEEFFFLKFVGQCMELLIVPWEKCLLFNRMWLSNIWKYKKFADSTSSSVPLMFNQQSLILRPLIS